MYARFSDAARQCLVNTNRTAGQRRDDSIGSLHILIGAIGAAPDVVAASGLDIGLLRESIDEYLVNSDAASAKRAIMHAVRHAEESYAPCVDVSHILLGILTEPDEAVVRLFQRMNVSIDAVRDQIIGK